MSQVANLLLNDKAHAMLMQFQCFDFSKICIHIIKSYVANLDLTKKGLFKNVVKTCSTNLETNVA